MEKIIFGGAVFSMLLVTLTFIISLSIFIWSWITDSFKGFKKDLK